MGIQPILHSNQLEISRGNEVSCLLHHVKLEVETKPPRVTFYPAVTCYEVMSRSEYSPEEFEASFSTADDLLRMKDNARAAAKKGKYIRGLESRTKFGLLRTRTCRANAYAAVFWEVDDQRRGKFVDENSIASAYHEYSLPAAQWALETAEKDALIAKKIYKKIYKKIHNATTMNKIRLNATMINRLTSPAA